MDFSGGVDHQVMIHSYHRKVLINEKEWIHTIDTHKKKKSQVHCAKWKESDIKDYILCNSFMTFWKRQNYCDVEQITGCYGLEIGTEVDPKQKHKGIFFRVMELFYILTVVIMWFWAFARLIDLYTESKEMQAYKSIKKKKVYNLPGTDYTYTNIVSLDKNPASSYAYEKISTKLVINSLQDAIFPVRLKVTKSLTTHRMSGSKSWHSHTWVEVQTKTTSLQDKRAIVANILNIHPLI